MNHRFSLPCSSVRTHRLFRNRLSLWVALLALLVGACSTPPDKKEGAVTRSVQQEAPPNQTAVTAESSSTPQILDVAVTQRSGNRTRLSITTDKKVDYNVKLDGTLLLVDLKNGAVTEGLMKKLDSEHAAGAIQRVQAFSSATDRHVSLRVTLRQLVPYHVTRDGTVLNVDFDALYAEASQARDPAPVVAPEPQRKNPVPVVAPEPQRRNPAPVVVPEPQTRPVAQTAVPQPSNRVKKQDAAASDATDSRAGLFEATSKQYAGQRMSFDFVDTDIRNILQLISEVAGINIVWGEDVSGKISMKLDNIPWDQALEMILRPNELTYQIENDVLWVVPKKKLQDIEISDGKRKSALLAEKRVQEIFEPKIIEYVTIKHRKADEIYIMLLGGEIEYKTIDAYGKVEVKKRTIEPLVDIDVAKSKEKQEGEETEGKEVALTAKDIFITYDSGTNIIVVNGIRSKVDKVKEIIAMLDVPEKQVMIEARVVEANTSFSRDLGIQWTSLDGKNPGFLREWYNTGSNFAGWTSFSTNAPSDTWSPNMGLSLGWLTDGGLGSVALNASLALAESDGKANIISSPKVLTLNGELAQIIRGQTAFIRIANQQIADVREVPATLSLNVIPTVSGDSSSIRMFVLVTDQMMAEDLNSRTEKNISANMVVRNGETIVIGGIYREAKSIGDSGVPWLKDIPILGWLFKAEEDIQARNELLIFITPTVVNSTLKTQG